MTQERNGSPAEASDEKLESTYYGTVDPTPEATDAAGGTPAGGGSPGAAPGDGGTEAEARAAELQESLLRARAETENVRRRAQDEVAKASKFAVESFADSLLPVLDSLEAALKSNVADIDTMRSGVELTLKQLASAFEKHRLLPVDPVGERFDPNRHQAISMAPSAEVPAQHVLATLQKGWTIADRVLRPALVTVSQGAAGGSGGAQGAAGGSTAAGNGSPAGASA